MNLSLSFFFIRESLERRVKKTSLVEAVKTISPLAWRRGVFGCGREKEGEGEKRKEVERGEENTV